MSSRTERKSGSALKGLMKKAQEAIKLVIGNSEVYAEEDAGGDLRFDPGIMMKIDVSFDKYYLPKEKVVKLNVRGNRFFHELKRDIREINGIFIVYPQEYEVQLDVRREEWEKRLISELNQEYQLSLESIRFFSEEEIARKYQRKGITGVRRPYHLKKGELLIVAGGFANFNFKGEPLCAVAVNLVKQDPEEESKKLKRTFRTHYYGKYSQMAGAYLYVGGEWYHNIFVPELYHPEEPRFFSFRIADDGRKLKFFSDMTQRGIDIRAQVKTRTEKEYEHITYTINPEYVQNTGIIDFKLTISYEIKEEKEVQEFSEGKELKDGIDIGDVREVRTVNGVKAGKFVKVVPIAPIVPIVPVVKDIDDVAEAKEGKEFSEGKGSEAEPGVEGVEGDTENKEVEEYETVEEFPALAIMVQAQEEAENQPGAEISGESDLAGETACSDREALPYLESEMILLPLPRENDISSYMMTIGDDRKNVKFYANCIDKEVSILAPEREEKIYHRGIEERVDYSIKLGARHYAISNLFLSRIDNRTLKLYFGWELRANVVERICLAGDVYIFGREPLAALAGMTGRLGEAGEEVLSGVSGVSRLIRLNKGREEFWRIGTSRDHGILLREGTGETYTHYLYNISLSYPVYLVKAGVLGERLVRPSVLEPVSGKEKQEKCAAFLAEAGKVLLENPTGASGSAVTPDSATASGISGWASELKGFASGEVLENNDLVIIGNRVFKYILPVVMETALSQRASESIRRKVQLSQSILR